jgi:UPF0755 protein
MQVVRIVSHHVHRRARAYVITGVLALAVVGFLFLLPPFGFPKGEFIVIESDASFDETASMLEEKGIIRSALLFKAVARIGQADRNIQAGRYYFEHPVGLTSVLYRLAHGISGIPTVRITFPEGYTVREMTETLSLTFPELDSGAFFAEAKPYEGYLFPDTYHLALDALPSDIVTLMRNNFEIKIRQFEEVLPLSGRSLHEIVTMASILEKEARGEEDMRIVSGILWKRADLGRALQVDAVFGYIKGVATYHPSGEDLEIDSPYNTYLYPGLPPGPIGNPGLEALAAALTPFESDYLYYLTGRDGKMYYADTFEEHKRNRELYLD